MDWMWVIFLIVGVGVWLVVTVFRKAEEERQRQAQQQRNANRGAGRRPATDLDRFLDEARRRREGGADRPWAVPVERPARAARQVQPPPRVAEKPRPFTPSVRRAASEPRPPASMAMPVPPRPTRPPRPQPAAAPVLLELVEEEKPAPPPLLTAEPLTTAGPPPQTVALLTRRVAEVSPAVKQVTEMLRQPQSLATAFVLSEIFGPPVGGKRMR